MISTKLDEKFDGFERELFSKVGIEVRSENARLVNLKFLFFSFLPPFYGGS